MRATARLTHNGEVLGVLTDELDETPVLRFKSGAIHRAGDLPDGAVVFIEGPVCDEVAKLFAAAANAGFPIVWLSKKGGNRKGSKHETAHLHAGT
jgi:hypothetical protein